VLSLSTAGALAVAGTVTGILSMKKVDQLDDRCPNKVGCNPADQPLADDARVLGNASTATFAIGGVAAVTGIVLLVVDATSPDDEPAAPPRASIMPAIGPGYVGVTGTF
jgi:hypothetical protein